MTSSARDHAIALLQQGCAHERNDAGSCRRPGAHGRDIDALLSNREVLRALAGEVPTPAGGMPFRLACFGCSTWQEFPTNAAREEWVWAHEREVGCTEFRYSNEPVPLVPAGGSAPAAEPERGPVTAPDCVECGGPLFQTFPSRQWHHWYPSHRDHAPVLPSALGAGGSAAHQGATTDAEQRLTDALTLLDELLELWTMGRPTHPGYPALDVRERKDIVEEWHRRRALLGAATTTAPEATP